MNVTKLPTSTIDVQMIELKKDFERYRASSEANQAIINITETLFSRVENIEKKTIGTVGACEDHRNATLDTFMKSGGKMCPVCLFHENLDLKKFVVDSSVPREASEDGISKWYEKALSIANSMKRAIPKRQKETKYLVIYDVEDITRAVYNVACVVAKNVKDATEKASKMLRREPEFLKVFAFATIADGWKYYI